MSENQFLEVVLTFSEQYESNLLNEFYDYWSEKNQGGKKMRWEMQKTWDITKRLKRWYNNQIIWHGQKSVNSGNTQKPGTSEARITALRNW